MHYWLSAMLKQLPVLPPTEGQYFAAIDLNLIYFFQRHVDTSLNLSWGTQKLPELLKKNYLKYLYKFETLVPFEVLPPATGCSNPTTTPNGNAVKGRQRFVGGP
jgi:hypothetical protein